jgi:hypothetical protein
VAEQDRHHAEYERKHGRPFDDEEDKFPSSDVVDLCERIDTSDQDNPFYFHVDIDFSDENLKPNPKQLRRLVRNAVFAALPSSAPVEQLRRQSLAAMKRTDNDNQHINFFGIKVNRPAALYLRNHVLRALQSRFGDIQESSPCSGDMRLWERVVDAGYNGLRMLGSQKHHNANNGPLRRNISNVYCILEEEKNDARRFPPTQLDFIQASILVLPSQVNESNDPKYKGTIFYEFYIIDEPDFRVLDVEVVVGAAQKTESAQVVKWVAEASQSAYALESEDSKVDEIEENALEPMQLKWSNDHLPAFGACHMFEFCVETYATKVSRNDHDDFLSRNKIFECISRENMFIGGMGADAITPEVFNLFLASHTEFYSRFTSRAILAEPDKSAFSLEAIPSRDIFLCAASLHKVPVCVPNEATLNGLREIALDEGFHIDFFIANLGKEVLSHTRKYFLCEVQSIAHSAEIVNENPAREGRTKAKDGMEETPLIQELNSCEARMMEFNWKAFKNLTSSSKSHIFDLYSAAAIIAPHLMYSAAKAIFFSSAESNPSFGVIRPACPYSLLTVADNLTKVAKSLFLWDSVSGTIHAPDVFDLLIAFVLRCLTSLSSATMALDVGDIALDTVLVSSIALSYEDHLISVLMDVVYSDN